MKLILILNFLILSTTNAFSSEIDCSEAYPGKTAMCKQITCADSFKSLIGTWNGKFKMYVRELSKDKKNVYRSFNTQLTYSDTECLQNIENNETFIIGRRTETFPKFKKLKKEVKKGLLINGYTADGVPFLKTINNENKELEFKLDYKNKSTDILIWSASVPPSTELQVMRFTKIDELDLSDRTKHKRNVTLGVSVGPKDSPYWDDVVIYGSHTRKK